MAVYNAPFFTLYETVFLVLRKNFDEDKTFELFRQIMETGLKKAYDATGFTRGNPHDFAKVVGERDRSVGLQVEFPVVSSNKIIYQFYTDPFPHLKGKIASQKLDNTYMAFKVKYLLGIEWNYHTTSHIWQGDSFTEHIITRTTAIPYDEKMKLASNWEVTSFRSASS